MSESWSTVSGGESNVQVSASLTRAPLLDLRATLESLRRAGVSAIHVDIEDGRFVPELNLGIRVVEEVVRWGGLPVDVHLMVEDPEMVVEKLRGLAVRVVIVHFEATRYPTSLLRLIRGMGYRAGLALNPATAIPNLSQFAPHLDIVLALSTEPTFDEPQFMESVLQRIPRLAAEAHAAGAELWVDGGVDVDRGVLAREAGADGLVIGRSLVTTSGATLLIAELNERAPRSA